MSEDEIVRRLRALIAMAPGTRPVSVYKLEQLAGVGKDTVREVARTGSMRAQTRKRLGKALTWLENDQIVIRPDGTRPHVVSIRAPRPPMEMLASVVLDERGPRIKRFAVNPNTFPHRRNRA